MTVYPDMSKEYCNLDIVALNKLIIDDVFHIDEEKYEDYVHSTRSYESCYKDIQDGKYDIMFIMNPVRVEQIRNITAMGERLPGGYNQRIPETVGRCNNKFKRRLKNA